MLRKSSINLTPLLDVMLILLFVFIMNSVSKVESAQADMQNLTDELKLLQKSNAELEEELKQSKNSNKELQNNLDEIKNIQQRDIDFYNKLTEAISSLINSDRSKIENMLQEAYPYDIESIKEILDNLTDDSEITAEIIKLSELSKRFYFVEVSLSTSNNILSINNKPAGISATPPEDADERETLKQIIVDKIDNAITTKQGGTGMILVSLTWQDDYVDKDAFDIVWTAIKQLENTYGNTRFFKTQYGYIKRR